MISESYIRGMRFFLACAVCDGVLGVDDKGNIIPDEDGVVRVKNQQWLIDNSPTYFKYYPKTGRVTYYTPEIVLEHIWRGLGMRK